MPFRIDPRLLAAALLTLAVAYGGGCGDATSTRRRAQLAGRELPAVFVHEANPVAGLSKAQLKAIFTGAIVNWKDVGGPYLSIFACTEPLGSGRSTLAVFQGIALDDAPFGPVHEAPSPADCLAFVARTPGGVSFASDGDAIPGVRRVPIDGRALGGSRSVPAP
ncbi:MAG: substrate-binding domain-containing protein [Anaeromyxobacteraceae bacterium]